MSSDDTSTVYDSDTDPDYEEEEEEYTTDDETMILLKKKNPEIYAKFLEVRKYLNDDVPKIDVLLKTPMHLKDKAEIVEMFEMWSVCEPLTYESLELKNSIKELLKRATVKYAIDQSMNAEIRNKVEQELKHLEDMREISTEYKIALLNIPVKYKSILYSRYHAMANNPENEENFKIEEWLSNVLKIPFGIHLHIKGENVILNLKKILDREFYGLDNAKEQVLLYVNNKINNPAMRNYPLGLVGSPGVGKTQFALAISNALNIPFQQLSGGGLGNSDSIHGHSYTYIGSHLGDITNALVRMECINGILFIDEFDTIPTTKSINSLLQIIDPVQNHQFKDNYVGDIPIDLSHLWFILSMNQLPEHQALADRIHTIHIEPYTDAQKIQILKNHTVPKMLAESKLSVSFTDDALACIVKSAGAGDGMRQCIHLLGDVISKLCFIKHNPDMTMTFSVCVSDKTIVSVDMVQKIIQPRKKTDDYNSMYS